MRWRRRRRPSPKTAPPKAANPSARQLSGRALDPRPGRGRPRWLWLSLCLLPAIACSHREPADVLAVRARMAVETAQLSAELDGLEARLDEDAARVRFVQELAARHRRISAIACGNLRAHQTSMARLSTREARRFSASRRFARADALDPSR